MLGNPKFYVLKGDCTPMNMSHKQGSIIYTYALERIHHEGVLKGTLVSIWALDAQVTKREIRVANPTWRFRVY